MADRKRTTLPCCAANPRQAPGVSAAAVSGLAVAVAVAVVMVVWPLHWPLRLTSGELLRSSPQPVRQSPTVDERSSLCAP